MTDDRLVFNPDAGPLGPADQAAYVYHEQRATTPLPDGWTHEYGQVPWMGEGTEWHLVRPLAPVTCGLPSLILCRAESPEYTVELLFLPYRADDGGPPDRPLTGGVQLELLRKDHGTPTDLEAEALAPLFCGPGFGPIFTLGRDRYRVLDGDPGDRPLPTKSLSDDPPGAPSNSLVRVVHCVLREAPASAPANAGETDEDLWGYQLPLVWKDNTRAAVRHDLCRTLKRRLRTLMVVHEWLVCSCKVRSPSRVATQSEREEAITRVQELEARYGVERLVALAGLPSTTPSCQTDVRSSRVLYAETYTHGQIAATRRLLRQVLTGRF